MPAIMIMVATRFTHICPFFKITSWLFTLWFSVTGIDGTNASNATNAIRLITPDTTNEACQFINSEIYVVMGTPNTVATLNPPNTTETAFGASFGSTCFAAATVATAQNTGCKNAGNIRAIISTVKLGD